MQPTARQHDADLSKQMSGKNTQKHDFGDATNIFFQKKFSAVAGEASAANLCEHPRTLNTVSKAKTSGPGLMTKPPGGS